MSLHAPPAAGVTATNMQSSCPVVRWSVRLSQRQIMRHIMTTSVMCKVDRSYGPVYEMERMDRYMNKMMNRKSQKDLLHSKGVVVSQGGPNFLSMNKGNARTISRRQRMISFHFAEGLTEILANNDDEIGDVIREEKVTISHVEVGQHYNILNVFWTTGKPDSSAVAAKLVALTGLLNKKMVEKNFMTVIPSIRFVFDTSKTSLQTVDALLKSTGETIKVDPHTFAPPTEVATGYHFQNLLGPRIRAKRVALFFEEFKRSQEAAFRDKGINIQSSRFVYPPDMRLSAQGLDYERIMNLVLSHMQKSRAETNRNVYVADPLPPAVWIEDKEIPADHLKARNSRPDTTVRLSTMRSFIVDHRKKRSAFYKEKEKAKNQMLDNVAEDHLYVMENLYGDNEQEAHEDEDFIDDSNL